MRLAARASTSISALDCAFRLGAAVAWPSDSNSEWCSDSSSEVAVGRIRLPEEQAEQAEVVARVRGTSVNAVIVEALAAEIERVRKDEDFTERVKRLLERDQELLERLAR